MKKSAMLLAFCFGLAGYTHQEVKPPAPLLPVPSPKQMAWHEMEMNVTVHFIINIFTGKEWGYSDESPAIFNPSETIVKQWVVVLKKSGFKSVILTARHHDGFCLWPSKFIEHSIKKISPGRK